MKRTPGRRRFPLTLFIGLGIGFALASLWPEINGDFVRSGVSLGLQLAGLGIFVGGWVYGGRKISPKVQPDGTVLRGAAVQFRESQVRQLVTAPEFLVLFAGQARGRGTWSVFDGAPVPGDRPSPTFRG